MKRREQRETVFRLVFRIPFCPEGEMAEQTAFFLARMEEQDEDLLPEAAGNMYEDRSKGKHENAAAAVDPSGEETDETVKAESDASRVVFTEEDDVYVRTEVNGILEHLSEIDKKIEEVSKGWEISRFGKAELAILRVAAYEILYDEDIPSSVAVNEAVEMAKRYCDEKARPFVNGVLSGLVQ